MAKSQKPTAKQKEFAKKYAQNGGNGTAAALEAYDVTSPKQAASIAARNLKNPTVQAELQVELKKYNITLPNALRPISKALNATKIDSDGTTVDDLDMQLKGSDRALKLLLPNHNVDGGMNINAEVKNISINIKNYGR